MYKNIKSIYSKHDFLVRIKEVTDAFNDKMKTAGTKGSWNEMFGTYIESQSQLQKKYKNQLKMICNQARSFGYSPDDLGLTFPGDASEEVEG